MAEFVHLHNHSDYSLLDGASSIAAMTNKINDLGMKHLAITDHGNLFGALKFYKGCISRDIHPIIGCEFYLAPNSRMKKSGSEKGNRYYHIIALAKDQTGYQNLIKLSSQAYTEGFYYKPSAWACVREGERVLEMGTAHGAVALLLAHRFPLSGPIEGLEIQEDLYDLAQKNLDANSLVDRVRFIRGDLRDHRRLFSPQSFDVVVVNPPYDSPAQARESHSVRAATARQGTHCTLADVAKAARFLLRNRGRFYTVIRANRVSEMMEVLSMNSMEPKRWRSVHHRVDREASVVLLQATRAAAKGMRVEPPLVVSGPDGGYTPEALTAYDTESGTCL